MIVLNILCANGHGFEGWFSSSEAFRAQCAGGLVTCPQCQSADVAQLPSAPRILSHHGAPETALPVQAASTDMAREIFQKLAALARNAENVGERFPEEARRIHYDEVPARAIRGIASQDETRDLLAEGILVLPAPVPPESETH